ncbi:MAG: hypothetical protein J6A54_03615 [Clostridia bacterium]|nr:hypothetical protein [Clostridia bacterium]
MYGENSHNMPIGLAMSFSSNPEALKVFLKMSNAEQDKIMLQALEAGSVREVQKMVDGLSHPPRAK